MYNGKYEELILYEKLKNIIYEIAVSSNIDDRIIEDILYLIENYESNLDLMKNTFMSEGEYYSRFREFDYNKKNSWDKYEVKAEKLEKILIYLSKELNENNLNSKDKEEILKSVLKIDESIDGILSYCHCNGIEAGLERIDSIKTVQSLLLKDDDHCISNLVKTLIFNPLKTTIIIK